MCDYKVADISKAKDGRVMLQNEEKEMIGMVELRKKYSKNKVLNGVRIAGCMGMNFETAVLIESLVECGAEVRWCCCDPNSTNDYAAAALAGAGIPVFAWKGETQDEFKWCQEQVLKFKGGPVDIIIDIGACLSSFIHDKYPEMLKDIKGIVEPMPTGIKKLYNLMNQGSLKVPVIDCNESAVVSKLVIYCGIRESLVDGIKRATNLQIAGKCCVVCGYGRVGKGVAESLKAYGGRVIITESDPVNALQAAMEGYQVSLLEEIISDADMVITATGNINVVTQEHIKEMKDSAILGNVGSFPTEIDVNWILKNSVSHLEIKPHVDQYTFSSGKSIILLAQGKIINFCFAGGHSSFVISAAFSTLFLSAVEFSQSQPTKYPSGIHVLPKKYDEEIAHAYLSALGGKLTNLTPEQAQYIGVPEEGPFKNDSYRY